jgi:hypothetical protein
MKRAYVFVLIAVGILLSTSVNAQYCGGNSGSGICTASTTLHNAGFAPAEDTLPCIVIGQPYNQVIQFHTPSTWNVPGGYNDPLSFLQIDTISNLPCGMCWLMGASNLQINGNATGCIRISNPTFDAPGEYQLHIIVDATTTFLGFPTDNTDEDLAAQGLRYFVRVKLPGDTCLRLDTLLAGNTASHSGTIAAPVIAGNNTVCVGGKTTLKATGTGYYAYIWSTGSFSDSITVGVGTYTVTVYGNCNSDSATTTVTVAPIRDTITASGSTSICQGSSVTLSVPTGSTYLWSNGATTNSISPGLAGTYHVTVTNSIGCSAVSSGVQVTVNPVPTDTITASGPLIFCPGGSVVLSGPPGLSYQWSTGNTTRSITANQTSTYSLIVTNSNNCSAISAQINVTESSLPNNSVTIAGTTSFCPGDSVTLTGTAGLNYIWSNGATTQSIAAYQAGSYILTVTNAINCSAVSSPVNVTFLAAPNDSVTVIGSLSLCSGGNVEFTAQPGLAYSWSNGSNAQSIIASQSGTYNVTVTNVNNCSAVSAPLNVTVTNTPDDSISASGPLTFCSGSSLTLSAISGYTYHWSSGATTRSINVTQTGHYSVTITNGTSCSATSTPVAVTVNPGPSNTITQTGSSTFCSGGHITLAAAAGLTYNWSTGATTQSITATQAGSYVVTVTSTNNCTASSTPVNVTVLAAPGATVVANGPTSVCPGNYVTLIATAGFTYIWSNSSTTQSITVNQGGSYVVTVTNSNQCSASVAAPLVTIYGHTTINTQPTNQVTCINGQVTFTVSAGGDSLTYQWQKSGVNINGQQDSTFTIPSAALADTGNYRVLISGLCGKDTSNYASLSVAGSLTFSQQPASQTICAGNNVSFTVVANGTSTTYQWKKDGQNITGATSATYTINSAPTTDTGSYTCYVASSCGNTTSNAAVLTFNIPTSSNISRTICQGSTYNLNGRLLTTSGTYHDTINNARNCDSIITLVLTVTPAPVYTYYDSLCSGSTYNFNGTPLTTAGTYRDTVATGSGCDSIVILHLSVKQSSSGNINAAICQGATYHFNGMALTTTGVYSDTLTTHSGCDSIIYLHLTVNQPTFNTINASLCGTRTYTFNGRSISSAGTYTDTLQNAAGCDSTITLNLTATSTVTYAYSATICQGGLYNFNGRIITSPGSYFDTIQASGGCDSVVVLHLIVNQPTSSSVTASVCAGHTYTFGSRTITISGTYYDTLNNAHNCDSIITLHLTVDAAITTTLHAAVCSGHTYSFNGQQLSSSGTYTAHLTARNGCDSTVTLVLQVGAFVTNNINAAVCSGSSYNFNGRQITAAGTYKDTLTAQGGCDSIVTLQLSVTQPATGNIQAGICSGGSYSFNGRQLTTAGNYNDTLTGANGCDSILTLTLQVSSFLTTSLIDTICQGTSYNFNGQSLSATGTYIDTLTAQGGCDSIVTLNLTVSHTASSTINATICVGSTYLFNGVQIGATGTYFEALSGLHGCDSIVTLNLVVNSFITNTTNANICLGSSYNFYGRHLTATGAYSDTLSAQGGCDSILVLNLTVNPGISHNVTVVICPNGSYNFNGRHLTSPGTYRDTLTNHSGCDSMVVLQLDTSSVLFSSVRATFCNGSYYNFNGDTLTAAGEFTDTLSAAAGCDSIVTLTLSVLPTYNIVLNRTICSGDTFSFAGHAITTGGTYSDSLTTRNGCDSLVTLNLVVNTPPAITWPQPDTICNNNDSTHVPLAAPSPIGGALTGNGVHGLVLTVNGSGNYPVTYTYTDSGGCITSVTKNLLVESCLGIEQITEESSISVFPNPANDVITAQADAFAGNRVAPVVYDMMGKSVIVPFSQQADKITFNTGKLAAGVYLIKFNINGIWVSKHFVKAD